MKTIEASIILGGEQMDITLEFNDDDYVKLDNDSLLFEVIAAASTDDSFQVLYREVSNEEATPHHSNRLH